MALFEIVPDEPLGSVAPVNTRTRDRVLAEQLAEHETLMYGVTHHVEEVFG